MISKFLILLGTAFLATSCNAYRSQFDCCPSKGVPCTSVSKIESMIVETQEGSDIFVGLETPGRSYWKSKALKCGKPITKVWIADAIDADGNYICGHYIYFQKEQR
jgi:hypothetical protein